MSHVAKDLRAGLEGQAGVPGDLDASAAGPYAIPSTRRRRAAAAVLAVTALAVGGAVIAGLVWLAGAGIAPAPVASISNCFMVSAWLRMNAFVHRHEAVQ